MVLRIILMLCLVLTGCARHAPQPKFAVRHCAEGSYPVKRLYNGDVIDVCAAITPECASSGKKYCPIVDYIAVGQPNLYLDPDADDAAQDKAKEKKAWWKFWQKQKEDKND